MESWSGQPPGCITIPAAANNQHLPATDRSLAILKAFVAWPLQQVTRLLRQKQTRLAEAQRTRAAAAAHARQRGATTRRERAALAAATAAAAATLRPQTWHTSTQIDFRFSRLHEATRHCSFSGPVQAEPGRTAAALMAPRASRCGCSTGACSSSTCGSFLGSSSASSCSNAHCKHPFSMVRYGDYLARLQAAGPGGRR